MFLRAISEKPEKNLNSSKMALWVDKYRPRELSKLDYHTEQASDLKRLCEQQDFPHLMFFGKQK